MNRKVKIAGSIMAAALFGAVFAGSTLALYTSTKTVNNHLISGNFQAMLYLTGLEHDELDNQGLIQQHVYSLESESPYKDGYEAFKYENDDDPENELAEDHGVNLSTYAGEIFMVEKIVPTMEGKATFALLNNGDVAFDYTISALTIKGYKWDSTEEKWVEDAESKLVEQVTVESTYSTSGRVLKHGRTNFELTFKFEDENDNNDAMNQKMTIDFTVLCTQVTKANSNQSNPANPSNPGDPSNP